jgi:hypothetical protein
MAINPDNITTIRVDQLAEDTLNLTNDFAHSNGTELKKATIQSLVDLVSTAIGSSSGVGYLAISVTDGQQLPDVPTEAGFFLAGAGTYLNINGYPDVICTENLNAIMSLTDHWELAVEIPINPLSGTVQSVTGSAVDNTDPLNPVINTTGGGGAVDSVNGQTGVVSVDLQSALNEGTSATDVNIELYGTGTIILDPTSVNVQVNGTDNSILSGGNIELQDGTTSTTKVTVSKEKITRSKGSFATDLVFTDPTANRTITFKNESGTVALLTDVPDSSTFVPYTGATANVDLGTHKLLAKDLDITHTSGSGDAVTITKGGSGEALKVVKTSGSGNVASITGGVTLIEELHLTTDLADAYISSAPTWNAKQDALSYTPYRYLNATQATYLGAVIGLAETSVAQTTILANTFNSSDLMKILFKVTKGATSAGVNMRIRVNTTNNLGTATQIGILTLGAVSTYGLVNRHINLFGGNAYNYNSASTLASDILLTNTAGTSFTYNTANDLYVFFTIQLGNVLDSATFQFANITN